MLDKKKKSYSVIQKNIEQSYSIALISHKNPDLDTLSSAIAFYKMLQANYPYKSVSLICIDDIPKKYTFLSWTELYKKDIDLGLYDYYIFFDSGSKTQTWFDQKYPDLFWKQNYNTLSIDHHITNELYAKQNILNTSYASTTMIIMEIFVLLWYDITPEIATCLLLWMYTDTGIFRHQNTTTMTYLFASKLLELWANQQYIIQNVFQKNSLSTIKLWWKIFSESFIDEKNILYSYVNKTLLESYNADYADIYWAIDYLNSIENVNYSTLLMQKWDYIKVSLRTLRDDIDVSLIAKQYDGGWHKKASWYTTKAQFQELKTAQFKI